MADNVQFQSSTLATPSSGVIVATDDVGGAQFQRVKLDVGGDGASVPITLTNGLPIGTLPGGTVIISGTVQALGSVQGVGTFQVLGSVQGVGTFQMLGTLQPLAGSVHIASGIPGTVQVLGSVQPVGTVQAVGTLQPLAGSVHVANVAGVLGSVSAQGYVGHGAVAAGNPVLTGAFGSSGSQAAVADGQTTRLWADLNGRLQVRGTIDSIPSITVAVMPTVTVVGTVQTHGTSQVLGSVQLVGTNQALGSVQTVGTSQVLGSVQPVGTVQAVGTLQPLAGSVHVANIAGIVGTVVSIGSVAHDSPAGGPPVLFGGFGSSGTQAAVGDGDAVRAWFDLNGRLQIRGTIDSMPAVNVATGTIPGGTVQIHGTAQVLGTVRALTEITTEVTIGTIAEGTINSFTGTAQVLGTVQTLIPGGTMVAVGSAVHGAAADARPLLMAAFGSSGTQVAVDDGDSVRLWADLNGRLQIRGTIDSMPAISVTSGTIPGGTVQTHGTSQIIGTVQPLAGSVHVANIAAVLGSVGAQGYVANGGVAAGNPVLTGAFGSSGTQAAVDDGDAVRLWADLNGRLQIRGTIDSLPNITVASMPTTTITGTVQTHGTSQALGTVQPLAGSVHVANVAGVLGSVSAQGYVAHGATSAGNPVLAAGFGSSGTQAAVADGQTARLWTDLNGRLQIRGTIDSLPAVVITSGTVSLQTGGTMHIGSVQRVAGTVLMRKYQAGEGFFGTRFTGGVTNGTLVPAPAAGTYVRLFDLIISGSAAGTAFVELGDGTIFAPLWIATNGGLSFNSSQGVRTNGTAQDILFTCGAGTWGVSVNYTLEIA